MILIPFLPLFLLRSWSNKLFQLQRLELLLRLMLGLQYWLVQIQLALVTIPVYLSLIIYTFHQPCCQGIILQQLLEANLISHFL